jgi:competence protein ComEA
MYHLKKYKYILFLIIIVTIILSFLFIKKELNDHEYDIESYNEEIVIENKEEESKKELCTIDIKGAVTKPNAYTTECNKKVYDIIELAGGLTDDADTSLTNLAKTIFDEMVIVIYTEEEVNNIKNPKSNNDYITIDDTYVDTTNEIENKAENNKVNINTAGLSELKTIPGIGDAKAKSIIEYRNTYGTFKDISDIKNVSGIGDKLYETIKIYLTT